jgi:hypothetical protein
LINSLDGILAYFEFKENDSNDKDGYMGAEMQYLLL